MMSVQASTVFSALLAGIIVPAENIVAPSLRFVICRARRVLTVAVSVEWTFLARLEIHMLAPRFALGTLLDSGNGFGAQVVVLPLAQGTLPATVAAFLGSIGAFFRAISLVAAWVRSELNTAFCAGNNLSGPFAHGRTKATLAFGVHAGRNGKGLTAAFADLRNGLALRSAASLVTAFFRATFTTSVLETIGGNLERFGADLAYDRCRFHECII